MKHFFNSRFLSDEEIWSGIEKMADHRNSLFDALAAGVAGTDPADLKEMSKQFSELDKMYHSSVKLQDLLKDLQELKKMIDEGNLEDGEGLQRLYTEYTKDYAEETGLLYRMLLEKGYISEEIVDSNHLNILKFIEYAGPEYAWRLGINIGIDTKEARDRLEILLEKGLLEKVQGTMLEGYHREKDWVKHMNHTYYRLSRKGRLFLRQLRRGIEPTGKV